MPTTWKQSCKLMGERCVYTHRRQDHQGNRAKAISPGARCHKVMAWKQNYDAAKDLYIEAPDEAGGEPAKVDPELRAETEPRSTIPAIVYRKDTSDNVLTIKARARTCTEPDLTPKEKAKVGTRYSALLDKVFPQRKNSEFFPGGKTPSKGGPRVKDGKVRNLDGRSPDEA